MNFQAFQFLNEGGWVAWVLASLSLILWYAIGFRYLNLKSDSLKISPKKILNQSLAGDDLLSVSLRKIQIKDNSNQKAEELELAYERKCLEQALGAHRLTIRGIVIVAPLLGLLGTVIGMIETFDSLSDVALFSQSGGIAGGISQALITTQMGLVVAIPGLLMGRYLDRGEESLLVYFEEVVGNLSLRGSGDEIC